jgi:hypothetical protein
VAVSAPVVAWQVYVPVPEVSYPVSATIVQDVPAASANAPIVQSPELSFHPRAGIVQAGDVAQSAPVYPLLHVQKDEELKSAAEITPFVAQAEHSPKNG